VTLSAVQHSLFAKANKLGAGEQAVGLSEMGFSISGEASLSHTPI